STGPPRRPGLVLGADRWARERDAPARPPPEPRTDDGRHGGAGEVQGMRGRRPPGRPLPGVRAPPALSPWRRPLGDPRGTAAPGRRSGRPRGDRPRAEPPLPSRPLPASAPRRAGSEPGEL